MKVIFFILLLLLSNSSSEISAEKITKKIYHGDDATPGTTNHVISIQEKSENEEYGPGAGHMCGGHIDSNYTILSAAHCFFTSRSFLIFWTIYDQIDKRKLEIVVGTQNIAKPDKSLIFNVQQYYVHHAYKHGTIQNDIAIIYLDREIPQSYLSKPGTILPHSKKTPPPGTDCIVSGWGLMNDEEFEVPHQLQTGILLVLKWNSCKKVFGTMMKHTGFCAQGLASTCFGDSGSPITCNGHLSGIVSFGEESCGALKPGVFTDVSKYQAWILSGNANKFLHNYLELFMSLLVLLLLR